MQKKEETQIINIRSASKKTDAASFSLVSTSVKAGFPSPASDFEENAIDLNKEFIEHPSSTFFCRVAGDSMKDIGIDDGDLLIVDKSAIPQNGNIAVCYVDGEFTLKKIKIEKDCCWLIPANEKYQPIKVTEDNDFLVWGIVKHTIKSF